MHRTMIGAGVCWEDRVRCCNVTGEVKNGKGTDESIDPEYFITCIPTEFCYTDIVLKIWQREQKDE